MKSRQWLALGAFGAILAISVAWWTLALWPLPDASPTWLVRTRAVCFGVSPTGLPDVYGWMTLIGQPVLMLGMLFAIWGDAVTNGLTALWRSAAGRLTLGAGTTLLVFGLAAAGVRVARAAVAGASPDAPASPGADPGALPRRHDPTPSLALVDQHGNRLTLGRFRGRPVLVTFVYAHCETECPLVVQEVLRAREDVRDLAPVVIFVTLDPWRDTPARLPAIAEQWRLPPDAFLVSGDSGAVTATLDRWHVVRARDLHTGTILHATPVYLIDREGWIAYAASGAVRGAALAELIRRLSCPRCSS